MNVGCEANDSGSKQFSVLFNYLILYYTVKVDLVVLHVISLKKKSGFNQPIYAT